MPTDIGNAMSWMVRSLLDCQAHLTANGSISVLSMGRTFVRQSKSQGLEPGPTEATLKVRYQSCWLGFTGSHSETAGWKAEDAADGTAAKDLQL